MTGQQPCSNCIISSLVQLFGRRLLGRCSPLAGGPLVFLSSTAPVSPLSAVDTSSPLTAGFMKPGRALCIFLIPLPGTALGAQ